MRIRSLVGALLGAWIALPAAGPAQAQQTTLHGQIRPRLESRDPGTGGTADTFTSMRVRLGLDATLSSGLSVFIQAQDVRIWGEERSTLLDFRADNLDMHQAYFRWRGDELDWLTATAGRMETSFGGERLVGSVGWTQQSRSFDGVRLDLVGGPGSVALVAYTLADLSAGTVDENRQLYGAYATREEVGIGALDAYWLYDRGASTSGQDTDEHAIGARYVLGSGNVEGRFEGTYQTGTRGGRDVSAFMFGGRIGTTLADGRLGATLWYDYLSGDDPSTPEVEVFNTLYHTGHKFYGFADVFTNIPAHTGGAGLQDFAVKLLARPLADVSAAVDLHVFRAAEQGALSGSGLAEEIDVTLTHRYSDNLSVQAGLSYVAQRDPLGEIGRLLEDQRFFYVMFDAVF